MQSALLMLLLAATPGAAPDTVLVCPDMFRSALEPWVQYRTVQGHRIAMVDARQSAEQIRADIRQLAQSKTLRFVLLVGDAEPSLADDNQLRARCVPTHYAQAKVNVKFGSESWIATDNWYGDLDDDAVPDVAVGRLTADTPEELSTMVKKVLAYEGSAGSEGWRRRINFVAGLGGFGRLVDAALEAAAKATLTEHIPAEYATSMTYASWRSPYCPQPGCFHQTTLSRFNEGCLFWVYLGHGQPTFVDQLRAPDGVYPIYCNRDAPDLQAAEGLPIALFLACYAGAFDAPEDCLGETMLRAPGGPVAVVGGTRVTMPYAMAVLGTQMLTECFKHKRQTLGELLLHAKRNMVLGQRTDEASQRIDTMAAVFNPAQANLADERAEHLLLFNLLGDPLLRLRYPRSVELQVPDVAMVGSRVDISGTSPIDGQAAVELVVRRDRLAFKPPPRHQYESTPAARAQYQQVYHRANDTRLVWREVAVRQGAIRAQLDVPDSAWGPCHVRVFVEGSGDFAMGSADVTIRQTPPSAATEADEIPLTATRTQR